MCKMKRIFGQSEWNGLRFLFNFLTSSPYFVVAYRYLALLKSISLFRFSQYFLLQLSTNRPPSISQVIWSPK